MSRGRSSQRRVGKRAAGIALAAAFLAVAACSPSAPRGDGRSDAPEDEPPDAADVPSPDAPTDVPSGPDDALLPDDGPDTPDAPFDELAAEDAPLDELGAEEALLDELGAEDGHAVTFDGTPGWHAEIVSSDLPAALEQGTTYPAVVVVRNVGTTLWRVADVKLGAVDDEDPLAGATRVYGAADAAPGETVTYSFTLSAPRLAAPRRMRDLVTDWRMVNDGPDAQWFGPTVRRHVSVYDAAPVETDTVIGQVLVGYQGWFTCPGAPSDIGWTHWCRGGGPPAPDNVTFDLWPDLREFPDAELCDTPFRYPDGSVAGLFSSANAATVERHFRWMKEYGIAGVFLQRFASELTDPRFLALRDGVLRDVMAAAAAHGRVFAVMYDLTGMSETPSRVERISNDWIHLVRDLGVTDSPRYLHHAGRPVLGIWGIGFDHVAGSHDEDYNIVNHLQNMIDEPYRATTVGGVPEGWRTCTRSSRAGYDDVYDLYAVLSPWTVGRYDDAGYAGFRRDFVQPDLADAGADNYLPVVFPGFSWTNLTAGRDPLNAFPRLAGDFLWHQAWGAWSAGARMLYVAMFDEVDEGTAVFKAAEDESRLPTTGTFLSLDADGTALPSDWYLRLVGEAANLFRGVYAWQPEKPIAP